MTQTEPGSLLLVEDDHHTAVGLVRFFSRYRYVRRAASLGEARDELERGHRWCGAVIDVALPDGSGMELLDELRAIDGTLPALVLTAHNHPVHVNRAHLLRAEFVCKPPESANLEAFAHRIVAHDYDAGERVLSTVLTLARRRELSPTETEILLLAIEGQSRQEMGAVLAVTANTLKTLTRRLLRKCEAHTLDELSKDVLRQAVGS